MQWLFCFQNYDMKTLLKPMALVALTLGKVTENCSTPDPRFTGGELCKHLGPTLLYYSTLSL